MIPEIHIEDYNYPLPDERIAKYPLPERDASKLLHYKDGRVDEFIFRQLPDLLPKKALMVFNDTKVVPARMHSSARPVLISRYSASNRSNPWNMPQPSRQRKPVPGSA